MSERILSSNIQSQTLEAFTIVEILNHLKLAPKDITIFCDIDNVVIAPVSGTFRGKHDNNFIERIKRDKNKYPKCDEILSNWRLQRKIALIEQTWPEVINTLKESYNVYGLTAMESGFCMHIPSLEEWRYYELLSLGIEFIHNDELQSFKPLGAYRKPPIFHKGIFFANNATKGETIELYQQLLNLKFVVMIDDLPEYLKTVEDFCRKASIGFLGIHYKGADLLPGTPNIERAVLQEKYLIEQGKWLEDDEAQALLL